MFRPFLAQLAMIAMPKWAPTHIIEPSYPNVCSKMSLNTACTGEPCSYRRRDDGIANK
jgi:hypothetical protein